MRGHNQLEPDALVDWFERAPPYGFELLPRAVAEPVGFCASLDLLTTVDPRARRALARWPFSRWWTRLLRVRTAFFGTTVTEYALLPTGDPVTQVAQMLARWRHAFRLLVIKDLPQRSPLLSDADNGAAERWLQACREAGFVLVEGQALAYVPVDFADLEGYLARLSRSRRQDLRRKLRSKQDLQVTRLATGPDFADEAFVSALYALYEGVHAQSEIQFDKLTRDFFAGLLRDPAASGVVFIYRRASDGLLVGWNLCFEHGGNLVDKYIGLCYPQARELNLYFVSWMVNLEYALERGLAHYIAGWTDPQVKRQLGAKFTMTRHAVYVRNPLLRLLGRCFRRVFESDGAWVETVR